MIPRWCQTALRKFYEALVREDDVRPADLVFVIAGRMERKHFGLKLFRAGVAPRLVLSIGRFEVSKMQNLPIDSLDELVRLRDKTPPDERHFFMILKNPPGNRIEQVPMARWNTYGEALAVRAYLEREPARNVIVVSSDIHLRRISLTFSQIFCRSDIRFRYCPVPPDQASVRKERWWARSDQRRFVVSEMLKLVGYRVIFWMPSWAVRRLMRLR